MHPSLRCGDLQPWRSLALTVHSRRTVLDQGDDDDAAPLDFSPGSDTEGARQATRRKLLEFARRAGAVAPAEDRKLQGAVREVKAFLKDSFHPVVFWRFVDTADYVARHLRSALSEQVRGESVSGPLPPTEREAELTRSVSCNRNCTHSRRRAPRSGRCPDRSSPVRTRFN